MPQYQNNPFQPVRALQAGVPEYLYGSFAADVAPTRMLVSQVEIVSDVATLTVTVTDGNTPAVGSLISVHGTQTGSGEFNVNRVPLTAVSISVATGVGTVSFALTGSNVGPVADAGVAVVDTPEVGDTLAAGSSVACTPLYQQTVPTGLRTISASCSFPTIPTGVTVSLQGANENIDSQYTTIGSVATVVSGAVTASQAVFTGVGYRFYRLYTSGLTGTGSIVGKVVTG